MRQAEADILPTFLYLASNSSTGISPSFCSNAICKISSFIKKVQIREKTQNNNNNQLVGQKY